MRLIAKIGSLSIVTMTMLLSVSCNNSLDSITENGSNEKNDAQLTSFSTGRTLKAPKLTRTSAANHQYLGGADFMWETGDKIYVKDGNNDWQTSVSSNIMLAVHMMFVMWGTQHHLILLQLQRFKHRSIPIVQSILECLVTAERQWQFALVIILNLC